MQKHSIFVDTSLFVRSPIAGDKGLENLLYRYLEGEVLALCNSLPLCDVTRVTKVR